MNALYLRLQSYIRRAPVSAGFALVAILFFAVVTLSEQRNPNREPAIRRVLGEVSPLIYHDLPSMKEIPGSDGPFDLWDGELWRLLASGFHHGGLFHLFCNLYALAILGPVLEVRLGRIPYFLFFLAAVYVSLLPEFLVGHYAIGLSGGICAILGALMVLKRYDPSIGDQIDDDFVRFALGGLILLVGVTALGLMHVANLAHFVGLGYGLFIGWLVAHPSPSKAIIFSIAHLLLIVPSYAVVHPFWNGKYHWNLARETNNIDEQQKHLQTAVRLNPELARAWLQLSQVQLIQGDRMRAWQTTLHALSLNRAETELLQQAQGLWDSFRSDRDRATALDVLEQAFPGPETEIWKKHLALDQRPGNELPKVIVPGELSIRNLLQDNERPPFVLPEEGSFAKPKQRQRPMIDPDRPDSALLGEEA